MNYKRALITGIMLWVIIFVIISVLLFLPPLVDKKMWQVGIYCLLLIPIVLLLCKWYFKMDAPSVKKGLRLGIILVAVATLLDLIITVPLFVKSYSVFFSDPFMYAGYTEVLLLSIFAGWEFDKTFTKQELPK